eukprot:14260705-Alexandrium_andersonii.AAC.1
MGLPSIEKLLPQLNMKSKHVLARAAFAAWASAGPKSCVQCSMQLATSSRKSFSRTFCSESPAILTSFSMISRDCGCGDGPPEGPAAPFLGRFR